LRGSGHSLLQRYSCDKFNKFFPVLSEDVVELSDLFFDGGALFPSYKVFRLARPKKDFGIVKDQVNVRRLAVPRTTFMSSILVVSPSKPTFPIVLTRSARLSHFTVSSEFAMLIPVLRPVNASENTRSSGVVAGFRWSRTAVIRPTQRENVSIALNAIPTTLPVLIIFWFIRERC
jgi:hypothetical protein